MHAWCPSATKTYHRAIQPGFGGQRFQESAVEKIERLYRFRETYAEKTNDHRCFEIMVDGGINQDTANLTRDADILVAGTFLFNRPDLKDGIVEIQSSFAAKNSQE